MKTSDGVTLKGQIDLPAGHAPAPALLMIHGTGPFDRDVHFSTDMMGAGPFDRRGLIFAELSEALVRSGVATVRFDKRGITCNAVTLATRRPGAKHADARAECLDVSVRHKVTPETIRADIAAVYDFAVNHPQISSVAVFAHSEGTVHVAKLIAQNRIDPSALFMMGAVAQSPKATIAWQMIERTAEQLMALDADGDGRLARAELSAALPGMDADTWLEQQQIHSPELVEALERGATLAELTAVLRRTHESYTEALADVPDDAPHGALASKRWWKMWFFDDQPVASLLSEYGGPVVVHGGSEDFQVPTPRHFAAFRDAAKSWKTQPELVEHEGLGHTLGQDPVYGPMDREAQKLLVDHIVQILRNSGSERFVALVSAEKGETEHRRPEDENASAFAGGLVRHAEPLPQIAPDRQNLASPVQQRACRIVPTRA